MTCFLSNCLIKNGANQTIHCMYIQIFMTILINIMPINHKYITCNYSQSKAGLIIDRFFKISVQFLYSFLDLFENYVTIKQNHSITSITYPYYFSSSPYSLFLFSLMIIPPCLEHLAVSTSANTGRRLLFPTPQIQD